MIQPTMTKSATMNNFYEILFHRSVKDIIYKRSMELFRDNLRIEPVIDLEKESFSLSGKLHF